MSAWLGRQRKQRLLELSKEAGLEVDSDSLKDEIIKKLDEHLMANAPSLSSNSSFDSFYGARRTPFKPRPSIAPAQSGVTSDEGESEVKSVVRQGGKRPSKVKNESTEEKSPSASSPVQAVTAAANRIANKVASAATATTTSLSSSVAVAAQRTPAALRRTTIPASPRDVADQVEYQTEKLYAGIDEAFTSSGIPQAVDHFRELCSSIMGVQLTTLLLEAFALQRSLLPWKYLTEIPWIGVFGMPQRLAIKIPDFFILLTGYFWSTTLLWLATSVVVPSLLAYFYNLTTRDIKRHGNLVSVTRYVIDPFTFNVIKALLSYIVYARGSTLGGLVSSQAATRVNLAMFGGSTGTVIGSVVCALASLYEAAQRK